MFDVRFVLVFSTFFVVVSTFKFDNSKKTKRCFPKNVRVDVVQFDREIPLRFVNCTREKETQRFTIKFLLERQRNVAADTVITLFAGPCSSSTATLNIGRSFPSIYGSLDESNPGQVVSSHLPSNERLQTGTITYEYAGSSSDRSYLISALVHVVIRHGRDQIIRGTYLIRFTTSDNH